MRYVRSLISHTQEVQMIITRCIKKDLTYDNDGMSGSFYLIAGAILLVITLLVYLFNPSMFK